MTYDGGADTFDIYMNGERVVDDNDDVPITANVGGSSPGIYLGGHASNPFGSTDFDGTMDETRFSNYERQAFAGGLMLTKVVVSTNLITIANTGDSTIDLDGVAVFRGTTQCGSELDDSTFVAGETVNINMGSCTLSSNDALRLVDLDGDNNGNDGEGNANDKAWIIDAICWNNDGTTQDPDCDASGDPLIDAGVWASGSGNHLTGNDFTLTITGDNDEHKDDWTAIPEFGTLLMPIASVLLIVGYSYRRREQLES